MKKVINIEKVPASIDEKKVFGAYIRKKCEITIQDADDITKIECYMDQEKINDFFKSFNSYLNNLLNEKRKNRTSNLMQKNMKSSIYYAIGIVGLVSAFLASTPTGVPFFLAAALIGAVAAVVTNIDLLKPFDSLPEVKEIQNKLSELEELEEESKNEQKNYIASEQRRLNMATLNQKELNNSNIIGIEELKQRVKSKTDWNNRRSELHDARVKANKRIYNLINDMQREDEDYDVPLNSNFRR